MPCGFKVQGPVDRDALSRALQELADMEPVLRTSFVYENNEIRQKIHDHVDILLEINDTDTLEQAKSQFVRPLICCARLYCARHSGKKMVKMLSS